LYKSSYLRFGNLKGLGGGIRRGKKEKKEKKGAVSAVSFEFSSDAFCVTLGSFDFPQLPFSFICFSFPFPFSFFLLSSY
jgi:hypothetical protein